MKKRTFGALILSMFLLFSGSHVAQAFSTADLAGTWDAFIFESNPALGTYWIVGTFSVDAAGNITGGSYTSPDGTTIKITSGSSTLTSDGVFNGSVVAENGVTGQFPHGKMDYRKQAINFVGVDSNGSMDVGVAIKWGGAFSQADLAGTWHVYALDTNPAIGSSWGFGTVAIDGAGNITGGSWALPDGSTITITGGNATIDADGVTSSTIATTVGRNISPRGKLDAGKTIWSFVGSSEYGSMDLLVAVKAGGAFSQSDLAGAWHAHFMVMDPAVGIYWTYGLFTMDAAGNVTGGSYVGPDGTVVNVTGGTLAIDANGLTGGSVTTSDGGVVTFPQGKLDPGKGFWSFVGYDTTSALNFGVAIKQ